MKHGLKQEIKRGLSVLMAISMVAGSALPVMAEEVVEEAVEVEVVNEDVAEEADDTVEEAEETAEAEDVVVDVAEVEETEIAEEVLVAEEEAANEIVEVDGPMVEAPSTHPFEATENSTYTLSVKREYYDSAKNGKFYIYYTCGRVGCNDPDHKVQADTSKWLWYEIGDLPTKTGKENGVRVTIGKMKFLVVLEKQTPMSCVTNTEGKEEYVLYSTNDNFENPTRKATDEVVIPVKHNPGKTYVVEEKGSCTKPAKVSYNCTKCGAKIENEELPAWGHTYEISYSQSNSKLWAADGSSLTIHVKCTHTDKESLIYTPCKFDKDITFTGEQIREAEYVAPMCTRDGSVSKYMSAFNQVEALTGGMIDYVAGRKDSLKGALDQKLPITLPALGHKDVTLTENPVPKEMFFNGMRVSGHDWGNVEWNCARCGKHTGSNALKWNSYERYNARTDSKCFTRGTYTIKTKTISEATCLGGGRMEWSIVCKLDDGQIVNGTRVCTVATGAFFHTPSEADKAKATCANPYKGTWICTVCGGTVNEPIYVEHKVALKSNVIVPATCRSTGVREGYCTVCKKDNKELKDKYSTEYSEASYFGKYQLEKQKEQLEKDFSIAKLEHNYKITNEYWDDGNWARLTAKCQNGCGKEVTQIVPSEVVYDKYPTYDQTGIRHYTATMDFKEEIDGQPIRIPVTSNKVKVDKTNKADAVTLSIADKTVEYTGDRQRVNVAASVVDGGNNVIANVAKEVVVKYYKDPEYTQQFSGEPYTAGRYYVKATLTATESHEGKTAEAVLVINKKNPTVTVKQSATTVKNTKKNKVNITVSIKDVIGQKGKVTYVADKGITVSKKGIVTIKKGTKKGTYKIKINVAATPNYNGVPKTIEIKVK